MNHKIKMFFPSVFLLVFLIIHTLTIAQEPPHPPSIGYGQQGNQQPGGSSAPVDGGLGIMLTLGLIACGKKVYQFNKGQV